MTLISGIGVVKAKKLHDSGIYKLEDVLKATQLPTGLGFNLISLQELIKKNVEVVNVSPPLSLLSPPNIDVFDTEKHSWFHKVGHILVHGSPTRVHILEFIHLKPFGFVLHVTWYKNKKWCHRSASPLYLIVIQHLWDIATIVSDDSENDEEVEPEYLSIEPFLGSFEILDIEWSQRLPDHMKEALQFVLREVSGYQNHPICLKDDVPS